MKKADKQEMTAEEKAFYASFTVTKPKPLFKVGDTVELMSNHPWAGSKGEIVDLAGPMKMIKVRLFDTQDHEVFAKSSDMRVMR